MNCPEKNANKVSRSTSYYSHLYILGGLPYANVPNELLLKYLADGHRMTRPEVCTPELYQLMQHCWSESPHNRPDFSEIVRILEDKGRDNHIYVNFDDIAPNYVLPPTIEKTTETIVQTAPDIQTNE